MTVEELLKPRYKVISDYPNSIYPVGQIVHRSQHENFYNKYPAIFKKLEWYEERSIEDMPDYLRKGDGEIIKAFDWRTLMSPDMPQNALTVAIKYPYNLMPATEEEYLSYINSKK